MRLSFEPNVSTLSSSLSLSLSLSLHIMSLSFRARSKFSLELASRLIITIHGRRRNDELTEATEALSSSSTPCGEKKKISQSLEKSTSRGTSRAIGRTPWIAVKRTTREPVVGARDRSIWSYRTIHLHLSLILSLSLSFATSFSYERS